MPFTLRNLKDDLEDVGANFDGAADLEFRMGTGPLELEHSGVTYQRIAPNFRVPFGHKHKRQEEIYVPEREEPIRLERRDPALQLLQMVRDETHRFAVSSHRRRRSKRFLHSELDDLPGIGEKRRRLLIERFGSVSGVKQASMQDLMNVLGRNVGQRLYDELHA